MPHKQALHLPSMLTAKAVYERMQLDLVQTISQAQFYKLWSQHFPHVTIPAVSALFYLYKISGCIYSMRDTLAGDAIW